MIEDHIVAVCQEQRAISASRRTQDQSRSPSPRYPYPADPVPLDKGNAGSGNEIDPTSIRHSRKSLRAYSLNAHVKSFRREAILVPRAPTFLF